MVLLLLLFHTTAHYLPFERAALAPDDYALLVAMGAGPASDWREAPRHDRGRPLNWAFLRLQAHVVGDNPSAGLALLFGVSLLSLLAAGSLFQALFGDRRLTLLASVLFVALPHGTEIHHTAIYANVHVALAAYMGSLALLVGFVRSGSRGRLALGLVLYGVGVFWYEVGFFAPAVLLTVPAPTPRRRGAIVACAVVALAYLIYRYVPAAHGVPQGPPPLAVGLSPRTFILLLHHYGGFFAVRNTAYGLLGLLRLPWALLAAFALTDALAVLACLRLMRDLPRPPVRPLVGLGSALLIAFVLPVLLQRNGTVGGRHLVLPSLGLILLLLAVRSRSRRLGESLVTITLGGGLLLSQGTTWHQVLACRLNAAVYDALQRSRGELAEARVVLVDRRSFVDAIPAAWWRPPHELLNTYYGAQAFEDWGLRAMVRLAAGRPDLEVVQLAESPRQMGDAWEVVEGSPTGSRAFERRFRRMPVEGSFVLDLPLVLSSPSGRALLRDLGVEQREAAAARRAPNAATGG